MATGRQTRQFGWLFRLLKLWIAGVLLIVCAGPRWASAQSTDDAWGEPVNLSHSGAATNPDVFLDSASVVHVIWQDGLSNYVYTRYMDGQWMAPQVTDLHLLFGPPATEEGTGLTQTLIYAGPNPRFIAGPGEYIFAFWLTPEGSLFGSRVLNGNFNQVAAWDEARLLSTSVASFAATADESGEVHLAFLRTAGDPENPAGIYYMRSRGSGQQWPVPVLLYESSYLRRTERGNDNLSLATGGTAEAPIVFVAWDNPPRKQVFLARSADGGTSWEEPEQVAGPEPDSGSAGPFNIRVGAKGNNAVLLWQSGEAGQACAQLFQSSVDGGVNWSEAQRMLEGLSEGCAQGNEFLAGAGTGSSEYLYLLTNIHSQMYLSAWNGSQWSAPQPQPVLSGFVDPEIYSRVEYGCHRAALFGGQLYSVGCDQGGGGDIWVISRSLASGASWFSPPIWSQPAPIIGNDIGAVFDIGAVEMVATGDNLIHTFFSQRQDPAIYYTRWDGTVWARITSVMQLPSGESGRPAVAAGPGNTLLLIVRSSKGSLYFTQANSSSAVTASNWSTPAHLRIAHDGRVSSAEITSDAAGTIYIAYSVLMNEGRGVYIIQSKDHGSTWSEPVQVFDGAQAGFDLVGSPSLLASPDGSLHVMWGQQSIQADDVLQPLSLHYSRSEDAGQTFNDTELVVEAPVVWQEIAADSSGNLHRLWQRLDMMTTLWDQVSTDGGRTWQTAARLPVEGETSVLTVDPAGQLHVVRNGLDAFSHWVWDGSRWQDEAPVHWPPAMQSEGPVELLATAVNADGEMVVLLAAPAGESEAAGRRLLYTTRTLQLPPRQEAVQSQPAQPPSPTDMPATTPTPGNPPSPAVTADSSSAQLQATLQTASDPPNQGDPTPLLFGALLPVALLLLGVLGFVTHKIAQVKDR